VVPHDLERLLEALAGLPLLARGAESELRLGYIGRVRAVFKWRVPRAYMHPRLDSRLRLQRTLREAKALAVARAHGVPSPGLLLVLPRLGLLAMEYVPGAPLRDRLEDDVEGYAGAAGAILARLHSAGIAHGDPTTSNYLVGPRGLVLIDYGLASFTEDVEDRAVDVHLFKRSVEATHPSVAEEAMEAFTSGYLSEAPEWGPRVIERAREIALRGRYVEERRRTVWGAE